LPLDNQLEASTGGDFLLIRDPEKQCNCDVHDVSDMEDSEDNESEAIESD